MSKIYEYVSVQKLCLSWPGSKKYHQKSKKKKWIKKCEQYIVGWIHGQWKNLFKSDQRRKTQVYQVEKKQGEK